MISVRGNEGCAARYSKPHRECRPSGPRERSGQFRTAVTEASNGAGNFE
jgi:hypothetical protein